MKFRMLFAAAALLALCTGMSFGQNAAFFFYELDEVLPTICGGSDCVPEGTMVEIRQDINNNGGGDDDPLAVVGTGPGEWNYNQFPMSQVGCGQFFPEAAFTSVGVVPANPRFYCRIAATQAIWRSQIVTITPGPGEVECTWSCEPVIETCTPHNLNGDLTGPGSVCITFCPGELTARWLVHCPPNSQGPIVGVTPGCDGCSEPCNNPLGPVGANIVGVNSLGGGTYEVVIVGAGEGCACFHWDGCLPPACNPTLDVLLRGDRDSGPSYACVTLQAGLVTLVRVCSPTGAPLNPLNTPIVSVTPGCEFGPTHCDFLCPPAVGILSPWTYDGACFVATLTTSDDCGCVCVGLEGFLAANVSNFDAVALSNSVRLDFATVSETNVDRFEIARTVKGHSEYTTLARIEAENSATGHSYSWVDNSALNGTTYNYRLVVVNADASTEEVGTVEATPSLNNAVITEYALAQNFPNPFNPSTQIVFDVVSDNYTTLKVFNANGQEVATLFNGTAAAGRHVVNFDAANLTSGLYFYTVKIGNEFTATKKMMLVK